MKSCNGKKLLIILLAVTAAVLAGGCSDDPIFSAIESEVKLKDPSVRGMVLSLVNHGGDLYTANGNLYRRYGGTGGWFRVALPANAYRCSQVATTREDGTGELYGLFQDSNWQFHSLQRLTPTGWVPVASAIQGFAIRNGDGFIYFFRQDNMSTAQHSQIDSSVYRVDETGTMTQILTGLTYISGTGELPIDAQGDYITTNCNVYDSTGTQVPQNGDYPTNNIAGIAVNGVDAYVADGIFVYHYNGTTWSRLMHNASWRIHNVTWLEAAGKQMILLPTEDGYGEMLLDGSGGLLAYQEPGTSLSSSISIATLDQYESTLADWNILSMFVVTSPVPAGNDYCIYAGIIDPEEDGLWSYYSNTRMEWNRE